jgi:hypothetical protein
MATVTIQPPEPPPLVILTMSTKEAHALRAVLNGDGDIASLRRNNNAVYDIEAELKKAGL